MEHPAIYEMRFAAHETQVAKINREGWKQTKADKGATAATARQESRDRVPAGRLAGLFALIARRAPAAEPTTAQLG